MAVATEKIEVVIGARAAYESTLRKAGNDFDRYGKSVIAIAAKVTGVIFALRKAWDLASAAATFDQQEQAFTNLAASHGENARQIIRNLQIISQHTVSTAAIMQSAGTAMVLGIPAEHLTKMMEIARASAKVMGETTEVMFQKLTVGLARMSKLRLDDLGILIDVNKANIEYAVTMGIVGRELTEAEKKQAFFNSAMKSGQEIIDRVGKSTLSAADAQAVFLAKIQDIKIIFGKLIISISAGLTAIAFGFSQTFAETLSLISKGWGEIFNIMAKVPLIGKQVKPTADILLRFADTQAAAAINAKDLAAKSLEVAKSVWKEKEAVEGLRKARGGVDGNGEDGESPASIRAAQEANKILSIQQAKFQKLRDMVIEEDLNDREMSALKLMRQLEEMEISRTLLGEDFIIKKELQDEFRLAEEDAHFLHESRLSDISKSEAEKRVQQEQRVQQMMINMKRKAVNQAIALFRVLGGESRAAAIVGIAINKAMAMAAVKTSTISGANLAFASQLIPGDPTSIARAAAARASVMSMGAINMALIAATGLAEVASLGGGGAGVGTAGGPPLQTQPAGPSLIGADTREAGKVININFNVEGMISPDTLPDMIETHIKPALENYSERDGVLDIKVTTAQEVA